MFDQYQLNGVYDETFTSDGQVRAHYNGVVKRLNALGRNAVLRRADAAKTLFRVQGITFTVYKDADGVEKLFPFDLMPRLIPAAEFERVEKGLVQRISALNMFCQDIYHDQRILREGIVPPDMIYTARMFRREMLNVDVPHGIYVHICGTDLIRDSDGSYLVLEDNCRTPSGVSYVLENRAVMKRIFPLLFTEYRVRPVEDYPLNLLRTLQAISPSGVDNPRVVVLTPGVFNSAYYEHSYLARQMGVQLTEGRDLIVENNKVFMRTTAGLQQVHVIYRRVDDDYLDPLCFRPGSMLGVPGLMNAYRTGNVSIANAVGAGVADDKAIYPFVPDMIRFYLSEEPILSNVPTYVCSREKDKTYVLEHLDELVVKATNEAGGYGMLMGPMSSREERSEFAEKIKNDPRNFIGQPMVQFSQHPSLIEDRFEGRRIDLRPYILNSGQIIVMPGGLTRVALRSGSMVVNSSQGGGSKDTWVLEDETA